MSDFYKLRKVFEEIGVEYVIGEVSPFQGYGYPSDWKGNPSLRAVGAEFVFDADGRFLGAGVGDEQTSVDYRV